MALLFKGCRGNFINRDFFDSKDKTKRYYNATFLVGEDVAKCQFISKDNYEKLADVGRLEEVIVDLSFRKNEQEGTYMMSLDSVSRIPKK